MTNDIFEYKNCLYITNGVSTLKTSIGWVQCVKYSRIDKKKFMDKKGIFLSTGVPTEFIREEKQFNLKFTKLDVKNYV